MAQSNLCCEQRLYQDKSEFTICVQAYGKEGVGHPIDTAGFNARHSLYFADPDC
jgi:hypothetical protein